MLLVIVSAMLVTPCVLGVQSVFKPGLGTINGKTEWYNIGNNTFAEVDVFKGVPYASGERFQYAQLNTVEDDQVFNAMEFGYSCPQECKSIKEPAQEGYFGDMFGLYENTSEDCLTLNIYRPANLSGTYPVLIWIHGGAFISGAGSDYDGGTLSAYADVVVVTINYRLGAFGFLSLGDDTPVNMGLDDQSLAIKWVYDNIAAFGGDENKITLAGSGAGAESITYHMLKSQEEAYFQRAIAFSGVISDDKIITNPSEVAEYFISKVCPPPADDEDDDDEEKKLSLECLTELTFEDILRGPVIDEGDILAYFGPTADEEKATISDLLVTSNQAKEFDLLIGVTENDASVYVDYLKDVGEIDDGVSETVFSGIQSTISSFYDNAAELISLIISNTYTNWYDPDSDVSRLDELEELLNDWFYVKPATELNKARTVEDSRKTFYMVFDHKTTSSESSEAANSEMVPYVFGNPLKAGIGDLFTDGERLLSYKMMDYVKNFMYFNNPSYGLEEDWEPYTDDEEYLEISVDNIENNKRYRAENMAVWLDTIPSLIENQEKVIEEARYVDVLGSTLSIDEAEDVIVGLVFALIGLVALAFIIATIMLALRNKNSVVYDMENNDGKNEIPDPPIYTPPSTLQKPTAALMATPAMEETPTIENHNADPLPNYEEHIYDNQPVIAEMHQVPPEDDITTPRPVSFSTFSGTDSGVNDDDEQERPDSALAALDNAAYEDSP
ncbi:cholinesterase-like [Antedon mediterranea]|uniref:cholinesterase-like n=1 Tax=Antedon mediterranea TaxID=105859 RepID=UPI003AF91E68